MQIPYAFSISTLAIALAAALPAYAAEAPDAGRTTRELTPALQLPSPSPDISIQAPPTGEAVPGGTEVTLQTISFNGNSLYDESTLKAVLGDIVGKSYDLAGLKGLAKQIAHFYQTNGYPFARAYLPVQSMTDGALSIEVVEGRYGEVKVTGDASVTAGAEQYLQQSIAAGQIIESGALERTALILSDQPGIKVTPIIRPGAEVGTGALDVKVERSERFSGDVGLDNFGNRYTGRNRVSLNLFANSPFTFGDQIILRSLYTEEDEWMGILGYSLPIGNSGLRGNVSYSHTYYELAKEFKSLDAHGTAKISSIGLSYPIIRSQRSNLTIAASYQHKKLNDQQDAVSTSDNKSSDSLPISLNFDHRDSFAGGGITYGGISWTHGDLDLDSTLRATDRNTAKTDGSFDKLNIDVVRLQALPANFTLFGRLSAQVAADNLDSSESFGLGGVYGVRAYPSGEGYGDEGVLGQLELRYNATLANNVSLSPFAFYDSGRVSINHDTWDNSTNHRSISGAGLGVRAGYKNFRAEATAAWRTAGGAPSSDTKNNDPLVWVSAGYKF